MNTTALIRPAWTPATIALMVIGFMVFWPLGLAMLAYIIWGDRLDGFKRDVNRATDGIFAGCRRGADKAHRWGHGSARTGNVAFDDWREKELERLAEERRKLDEMLSRVRRLRPRTAPRQGPGRVRPLHGEPQQVDRADADSRPRRTGGSSATAEPARRLSARGDRSRHDRNGAADKRRRFLLLAFRFALSDRFLESRIVRPCPSASSATLTNAEARAPVEEREHERRRPHAAAQDRRERPRAAPDAAHRRRRPRPAHHRAAGPARAARSTVSSTAIRTGWSSGWPRCPKRPQVRPGIKIPLRGVPHRDRPRAGAGAAPSRVGSDERRPAADRPWRPRASAAPHRRFPEARGQAATSRRWCAKHTRRIGKRAKAIRFRTRRAAGAPAPRTASCPSPGAS